MEQEQETQLVYAKSEDSVLAPSEEKELQSDQRELTASPTEHDVKMHVGTEQLLNEAGLSQDEGAPMNREDEERTPSPIQVPAAPAPSPATTRSPPPIPPLSSQQVSLVGPLLLIDPQPHPSATTAAHSSTLLFPLAKHPLSTAAENSTEGDLIYDRLPATPQRPTQLTTGSEKPILPVTTAPKPDPGVEVRDTESQEQKKKKATSSDQRRPSGRHPNNHMILTIVSMVLCGLILNVFAFTCLIPALIFAKRSTRSAESRHTSKAEAYARKTFILNLVVVAVTFAAIASILVVTQIVFGVLVY